MEHGDFVRAIRREGGALEDATRTAGIDAGVVSCPDWTIADLLAHVGLIHHWVADIVRARPADPVDHWRQHDPPPPVARMEWFATGCAALADGLAAAPPHDVVWTWTPDRRVGFWSRRMAHELAIHRWDAQTAIGETQPIERELAVDGIQETFDILPVRTAANPMRGDGETIHLHCTDGEGEWLIRLAPTGVEVTREHAKGDVAARAGASDLLLLMWGRLAPDAVDTFGDAALLARWQELAKF
jgi:uncharacterized protein (TIGR03083 family)